MSPPTFFPGGSGTNSRIFSYGNSACSYFPVISLLPTLFPDDSSAKVRIFSLDNVAYKYFPVIPLLKRKTN